MKYIIFENKYPVIFPNDITHCDVDISFYDSVIRMKPKIPTSAGHLTIKGNKVTIYGESESLGLKPKPDDEKLLELLIKSKE